MTKSKESVLSAQVLLRSASGKPADGRAAITAANIDEYRPSPEVAAGARQAFARRGFQVGEVVGNSFSITASGETFEKLFQARLRPGSYELPLAHLPEEIARFVEAVTFSPPPDFGPTGY